MRNLLYSGRSLSSLYHCYALIEENIYFFNKNLSIWCEKSASIYLTTSLMRYASTFLFLSLFSGRALGIILESSATFHITSACEQAKILDLSSHCLVFLLLHNYRLFWIFLIIISSSFFSIFFFCVK